VKLTDFGLSTGCRGSRGNDYYQLITQGSTPSNLTRPGQRESVNLDQISLTVSNRAQINEWRRSRRLMAYSAVGYVRRRLVSSLALFAFPGKGKGECLNVKLFCNPLLSRRDRQTLTGYLHRSTPDYLAPDILTGRGYSFDVDWWALGTIMYECLVGWPPFCSEDRRDTYRKIGRQSRGLSSPL